MKTISSGNLYNCWLFRCYLILLLWLPLPFASNRQWSAMFVVAMSLLLMLAWLQGYWRGKYQITPALSRAKWAVTCLFLVQLVLVIQLLPLPWVLLEFLSPAAAQLAQQVPLSEQNVAAPLSLSRHSTLYALFLGVAYSCCFCLALLLINSRERLKLFYQVLIFSGVFQAAYGAFMVLSGQEYLLLVKKWAYQGMATGTFVNRNHLAGYLNLCLAVGIGVLLLQLKTKSKKLRWRELLREWIQLLFSPKARLRVFLAVMVIGLVMTRSRMGNTAFFSALILTGLIFVIKEKRFNKNVVIFFVSMLLVDMLIIGNWFGFDR